MKGTPHAINKTLAGLAVGLILLSGCATPRENAGPACAALPPPLQVQMVRCVNAITVAKNPTARYEDLDDDAINLFIAGLNATEPPTAVLADSVRIYSKPGGRSVYLVIGFGGRVIHAGAAVPEAVAAWRAGKPWQARHNSL